MKIENIGNFEERSYTECPLYKKMTEGHYPWGSDEDKVLKYCANDVVIIAEQMARDKQKELEGKVEKYEKILCDIYSILHPYSAKNENISAEMAFIKLPDEVEAKTKACKDNFDECIRQTRIIDELKTENARLKETTAGNYKASIRKDELIKSLREKSKNYEQILIDISRFVPVGVTYFKDLPMIIEQMRKTGDLYDAVSESYDALFDQKDDLEEEVKYWKERCHNAETDVTILNSKVEVLDKRNTNQSVIIGEKGKEIENLKKKNREWQIRYNDLLFQEKLNKSAFGYDYEEENSRLRVENERLRNQLKYYPTYSAMKAEDKIEHIQKEAKKWKNKYKEAYDILETYFKYDLVGMEYDVSYDELNLRLSYSTPNGDKTNKYNALTSAYERLKKL